MSHESVGRRIVAELEHRGLSATPAAFAVWHEFLTGTDLLVRCGVEKHMEAGTLTDEALSELYASLVRDTQTEKAAERSSRAVLLEMESVANLIRLSLGSNTRYSDTLSELLGDMAAVSDIDALDHVIKTLVMATEDAKTANDDAQRKLEASHSEIEELRRVLQAVQEDSLKDALTGVSNRRHFERELSDALSAARVDSRNFCLMMIDIDHFKLFNDRHGHLVGDKVLRVVAQALRERLPRRATIARFGGEEFAVILPEADLHAGWTAAESARQTVNSRELVKKTTGEKLGRITVSIGVGMWRRADSAVSLIARADGALLAAKRAGRNRTITEDQVGAASHAA